MKILAILMTLSIVATEARAITLAKDGKSDYTIVLAEKPLPGSAIAFTILSRTMFVARNLVAAQDWSRSCWWRPPRCVTSRLNTLPHSFRGRRSL